MSSSRLDIDASTFRRSDADRLAVARWNNDNPAAQPPVRRASSATSSGASRAP